MYNYLDMRISIVSIYTKCSVVSFSRLIVTTKYFYYTSAIYSVISSFLFPHFRKISSGIAFVFVREIKFIYKLFNCSKLFETNFTGFSKSLIYTRFNQQYLTYLQRIRSQFHIRLLCIRQLIIRRLLEAAFHEKTSLRSSRVEYASECLYFYF